MSVSVLVRMAGGRVRLSLSACPAGVAGQAGRPEPGGAGSSYLNRT